MTVSELKALLNDLPDDREIVFQTFNEPLVDDLYDIKKKMISGVNGNEFEAYVISSDGLAGEII